MAEKEIIKSRWIALLLLMFWWGALVLCAWVFKSLLQANASPEFGAGIVGGAIWAFITSRVWQAIGWAYQDFKTEWSVVVPEPESE